MISRSELKNSPPARVSLALVCQGCCSSAEGAGVGSCWGHLPSNNSLLLLLLLLHLQLEGPAWTKDFPRGFHLQSNGYSALILSFIDSSGLPMCRTKEVRRYQQVNFVTLFLRSGLALQLSGFDFKKHRAWSRCYPPLVILTAVQPGLMDSEGCASPAHFQDQSSS